MDKRYYTVRMDKAPRVGEIFSSSLLQPAPAPDKWWKVMLSPARMVSGAWAVTLQECIPLAPKPDKGPVGEHVHALLRAAPPEPTLGMIYAEVQALRQGFDALTRGPWCIFEFAESRVPIFREGFANTQHELETVVDADRCNTLAKLVDKLQQEVKKLRADMVDGAALRVTP